MIENLLEIHPRVKKALDTGKPVVALESTIVAFGMPWPENLQTAKLLEEEVARHGAVPATIALLNGKIHIGLNAQEMELLARSPDAVKVSRRDLAYALTTRQIGATTVASTMFCADLAGIRVFATGGIGGVHRDGQDTMDVSADLTELSRTKVAVVCAGAKSVLDLGRTLEVLETLGVPVIGYGTDQFPSFYTRESGFPITSRLDDPQSVARLLQTQWDLGLDAGVVIANPVPEEHEMDPAVINAVIEKALGEAEENNITGKEVTPYLLSRSSQLTEGACLKTNIELARNNARVAAQIASCLEP